MNMDKGELFFRLTGSHGLGISPFIKINQLHQEANVRLTIQIVMNVLVPKKGSKEQIKIEEGRLLYAMIYGAEINLAKMIVDRLRAVVDRKSSPICYAMHLAEMMARAGVNLLCAEDDPRVCKSEINHHTLRRLGYTFRHGGWDYVGKGRVNVPVGEGEGERDLGGDQVRSEGRAGDTQEETTLPTQAESAAPSSPHPRPSTSILHLSSQIANLPTKAEFGHFRSFISEQFQLLQATLLSKLDSMDARLQVCESHILHHQTTQTSQAPQTSPHDPKGKAPIQSPQQASPIASTPQSSNQRSASHHDLGGATSHTSPLTSHHSQTQTTQPHPSTQTQPHSPQHSQSSHHSPSATQFELVARTTPIPLHSTDSEATQSASFLATPTPPIQPQPSSPQSAPSKAFKTAYQRRKKPTASQ